MLALRERNLLGRSNSSVGMDASSKNRCWHTIELTIELIVTKKIAREGNE